MQNVPTIVRSYRGRQQADAVRFYEADAARLAQEGYVPTSQSWAPGQWGCGAFLVALLLFVVLIGILVFIYMLVVKPEGTLTVTYSRVVPAPAPATPAPARVDPGTPSVTERLRDLRTAHDAGLVTDDEYAKKRDDLLSSL